MGFCLMVIFHRDSLCAQGGAWWTGYVIKWEPMTWPLCRYMCRLWQYGLWSYRILRIGLVGRCQKEQNHPTCWLSKSIFYVKNYPNLSQFFFSLKNINLGARFLLLTFFDNIIFYITFLTKMMPNFWHFPINPILKIQ